MVAFIYQRNAWSKSKEQKAFGFTSRSEGIMLLMAGSFVGDSFEPKERWQATITLKS